MGLTKLKNKIVCVTGANGQLGSVLTRAFLDSGAKVLGLDLCPEAKNKVTDYLSVNIALKEDVKDAMSTFFAKHGPIDILINNAGVSYFTRFENRTDEEFEATINVNLKGTFNCINEFAKNFDSAQGGAEKSIVSIASIYGCVSPDFRIYGEGDRKNSEVYGASKAGIIQMTKYFAVHLAQKNIRVNSVSPGGIFNDLFPQSKKFIEEYNKRVPLGRMAKAEEIVGAVLYLASPMSSYTNGHNLVVDGGLSCW